MNKKLLIVQALLVMMLSLGTLSQGNQALMCHSDYIDVITCKWNRSSAEDRFLMTPATSCSLQAELKSELKIPQGVLMPVGSPQQKLYEATLKFSPKALNYGPSSLPLKVLCENMTEPVEFISKFRTSYNIKLYPPEKLEVNGQNVTWELGSPLPMFIDGWLFELQWKQRTSSWESKSTRTCKNLQEKFYSIEENMLILGEEYAIRVRSAYKNSKKLWSEWSSVTEWTSTVGNPPTKPTPKTDVFNQIFLDNFTGLTSLVIFIVAVVFAVAFFYIRRSLSLKSLLKPKPSEYFHQLFADGGDFKCPSAIPNLYLKPESEDISPVEVDKCLGFDPLLGKPEKSDNQRDNSNSMTSCFSNSTYFLSQSSKCAVSDQLQPCSTDCPYGPAGGTGEEEKRALVSPDNKDEPESSASSPIEPSPSCDDLHKLRIDVQSPDSGFAASTDDQESQDESGSEGLPSPPVMDNVLPLNCILQCPVPQLSNIPHPLLPPSFPWSPWNSLAFQTLPPGFTTTVPFGNSKLQAWSGMVEPSDDGYKPVTKVQE